MYMANMSWNSAMNVPDTLEASDRRRIRRPANTRSRSIIYSDAYASEMVAYADLILPDTTYLERWDCISLLDRPISEADGPADAIRQPVVEPDRDVRPFQDVLLDLGARLGLPGMTPHRRQPALSRRLCRLHRQPRARAGHRAARRLARRDGKAQGRGAPNPEQLEHYIDNGCHWFHELPEHMKYYRHVNRDYLDWATFMGFIGKPEPIILQLYCEPLQKFRLAARRPRHGRCRPPRIAPASRPISIPSRSGIRRSRARW